MGVNVTALRALALAKRIALVDFSRTVMLGRQQIHFLKHEFKRVMANANLGIAYNADFARGNYAEPLLASLGADHIASIDASDFEGASLILDFNEPLDGRYSDTASLFVDFGSIEHIFNTPQLILNVNQMLRAGGSAIIMSDANGDPGHGFYQFSPEFFYSVFSSQNGFTDTFVVLVDAFRPEKWHLVRSPASLRRRNRLVQNRHLHILCFTKKIRTVAKVTAQQSDYEQVAWHDRPTHRDHPFREFRLRMADTCPFLFRPPRLALRRLKAHFKFKRDVVVFEPETVNVDFFKSALA